MIFFTSLKWIPYSKKREDLCTSEIDLYVYNYVSCFGEGFRSVPLWRTGNFAPNLLCHIWPIFDLDVWALWPNFKLLDLIQNVLSAFFGHMAAESALAHMSSMIINIKHKHVHMYEKLLQLANLHICISFITPII